MTYFTILSFVCLTQAAKYGVADLLMSACLRAVAACDPRCANKGFLVPLPSEVKANVLKRGLSCLIGDCTFVSVSAILVLWRDGEVDCAASDFVG